MATHKALLTTSYSEVSVEEVPKPTATPGSAVVKVLAAGIVPYMSAVLSGARKYPLKFPLVPGASTIARVSEVGPDAVSLKVGQLVFCESTVKGRDENDTWILMGVHSGILPGSDKLMDREWRNGSFAEYAKFPLENLFALNEEVLIQKLGYKIQDLGFIPVALVPYGGLRQIEVLPGDTVIVAPATGKFGGAAVITALAMGATVIAASRNPTLLSHLTSKHSSSGRLSTVVLTGDKSTDTTSLIAACSNHKGADRFIDFSPPEAIGTTHIAACISALRPRGKACLMGGIPGEFSLNYMEIMGKSLEIHGRFMYGPDETRHFIKMVEAGILRLGEGAAGVRVVDGFPLEKWEEAFEVAKERTGWDSLVSFTP